MFLFPGLVELFGWSFGGSVVGLGLSEQKKGSPGKLPPHLL